MTQELLGARALKSFLGQKPFTAFFRKVNKDTPNAPRFARCDFKPRKRWHDMRGKLHRLKGVGQRSDTNEYLVTFDRTKKNYITIPVKNLKYVKQGKYRYLVEVDVFTKKDKNTLPLFRTLTLTRMP
tara:strand:- start:224 stop:604 length:381 start_codon:yes stop_codon:yes gene_type:complete